MRTASSPPSAARSAAVTALRVPPVSITMESVRVLRWLVADGAAVRAGETVVEIETDKSTVEVSAPSNGTIAIRAEAGATVAPDAVLAEIG
jgi:pyruvate/2-oxoglutarate dehydrogenase complex dihydrolipoamide acyltransferase (E2) component